MLIQLIMSWVKLDGDVKIATFNMKNFCNNWI